MKIIKYFFEFVTIISLFCIFKIIGLKMRQILEAFWENLLDHFLDQSVLPNKI